MFTYKKYHYGSNNNDVVIFLPGWKCQLWQYWIFAKVLQYAGFYVILYIYSNEILTPNPDETVKNMRSIQEDVSQLINSFKNKRKISLFSTSVGTVLAFLIGSKEQAIQKYVINLSGADIAETVWSWRGRINTEFEQYFDQNGITLDILKRKWSEISAQNNAIHMHNKQLTYYSAKKDEVIPFVQQNTLFSQIQKNNKVKLYVNEKHSHFGSAMRNLFGWNRYISFLR